MLYKSGKQGIELEGYVQRIDSLQSLNVRTSFRHQDAVAQFQKIHPNFLVDDGKPEFFSEPKTDLGSLESHIRNIITQCIELSQKNNWIYSLIGCSPFFNSFAGGHIHNSISSKPSLKEVKEIRRKLFSVQPFIALLSQNSPIMNGKESIVKDVRLAYSTWSGFTSPDTDSTSHYIALARGRKTLTLECRLPSSASIYQILAVASFVKTIINFNSIPLLPFAFCKDNFFKVIKWGGQALIPVINPSKLSFLGLNGKEVYIPISSLFKIFLDSEETKEVLGKILSEFRSDTRNKIYDFYELISRGYTASDYILGEFKHLKKSREAFSLRVAKLTEDSYAKKIPFWETISKPVINIPKIKSKISIKELKEILDSYKDKEINNLAIGDIDKFDNILFNDKLSIYNSVRTQDIIRSLINESSFVTTNTGNKSIGYLLQNEVIEEANIEGAQKTKITRGKLFSYVVQLCNDNDLI